MTLIEIINFNKNYNGLPDNGKPYIDHRMYKSNYKFFLNLDIKMIRQVHNQYNLILNLEYQLQILYTSWIGFN